MFDNIIIDSIRVVMEQVGKFDIIGFMLECVKSCNLDIVVIYDKSVATIQEFIDALSMGEFVNMAVLAPVIALWWGRWCIFNCLRFIVVVEIIIGICKLVSASV